MDDANPWAVERYRDEKKKNTQNRVYQNIKYTREIPAQSL